MTSPSPSQSLERRLGVWGAAFLGLGSMLGTGVFVSLALALGVAGNALPSAILLAAGVALLNGLSSASLARSHPVSGGTYEYGYHYLDGRVGFFAGWFFLCAKSASAAAAALTLATTIAPGSDPGLRIAIAAATILVCTLLVLRGLRLSTAVVVALVAITIAGLGYFVIGAWTSDAAAPWTFAWLDSGPRAQDRGPFRATLGAAALIFVAYTGYGRIATLGEEILEPRRNIPRALLAAIGVSLAVYLVVATALLRTHQPAALYDAASGPGDALFVAAAHVGLPATRAILSIAVCAALVSVLLNLILGLSRVLLAMARRGDMPGTLARLNERRTSPPSATLAAGAIVAGMLAFGDLYATWSFSAVTVLLYYGTTHVVATRLPPEARLGGRGVAPLGAIACLVLALHVDPSELLRAAVTLPIGVIWYALAANRRHSQSS
jgi:APA family basic amino acid/polyamine antiporter